MAKLPLKLKAELDVVQAECIPHVAAIIARMEGNCDNLPDWIASKSKEYYEGLLQGHYAMIERCLSIYGAYKGYMEQEKVVKIGISKYVSKFNVYCF